MDNNNYMNYDQMNQMNQMNQPNQPNYYGPERNPKHAFSVAALIFGILGILTMCCVIGFIPGILSIIFAVVSVYKTSYGNKRMETMAVVGLVLGILSTLISIALLVGTLAMFNDPTFRSAFQSAYESVSRSMEDATRNQ